MTNSISDEEIRVAAYYLWEKEGRPEGVEFDFWVKAKNELAKKSNNPSVKAVSSEKEVKKEAPAKVAPTPAKKTATKSKKR